MKENSKKPTTKKRTSKKSEIVSIEETIKPNIDSSIEESKIVEIDQNQDIETISVGVQDVVETITVNDVVKQNALIAIENEKNRRRLLGFN